jgi:hypothetical protein
VVLPADFDRDGDIDLFVGGRLVPWRYGLSPRSVLLRNDGRGHFTDATDEIAPALREIGMITDAVWADYDVDGWKDLVLVGDWMPITFFRNDRGRLAHVQIGGLEKSHGWWSAIAAHDLDGDGLTDFIAGNLGLNTRIRASDGRPLTMLVHDFDRDGFIEQIISQYNGSTSYPLVLRSDLVARFPFMEERFPTYESYAGKTVSEVFQPKEREGGIELHAYLMASSVIRNIGDGRFALEPLPQEAQLAPIYAISPLAVTGETKDNLIVAGNFSGFKPEIGNLDAGRGLILERDSSGEFVPLEAVRSGINLGGDVRDLRVLELDGRGTAVLVVRNNGPAAVYLAR